ncbi:MAG: DEAD/DEAH box helicase [Muribaculaceae bacterium]|nr:DEAD/DEAH box helicase [Muribaculaceae bacterium]
MQNVVIETWQVSKNNIVLYSPTGSGKTLAFTVPILLEIQERCFATQVVIIEPTRELVLQTTEVLKKLAPSIKVTSCYGGHNSHDERHSLSQIPVIVVATPGRLLDHIERETLITNTVSTLVLDEFDKSLELGFAEDMRRVICCLSSTVRMLMTSATIIKRVPDYIDISHFMTINFLQHDTHSRITTWQVNCGDENRLTCLINLMMSLPDEKTIVFTNTRDTAHFVYRQLIKAGITSGLYIGTLEQSEREKVLAMFKNGSLLVLVSSDLGGRGIDISDIKHIIHYEQPLTREIFTHRNGRTARVNATGEVYVIVDQEDVAPFIKIDGQYSLANTENRNMKQPTKATIRISAGKKEKISRGDIVGYLLHNCHPLDACEIAGIDIFDHYTLVGLPVDKAEEIVKTISPFKLKKQKVKSMVVSFRPKFI